MKKLLCLLLTLCVVLGGLVITTSAEDEVADPVTNETTSDTSVADDPSSGSSSEASNDTTSSVDDPSVDSSEEPSVAPSEDPSEEPSEEPSRDPSVDPGEECTVTVEYDSAVGTVTYDKNKTYHVGDTLSLNININGNDGGSNKKGIKSISVNDKELDSFPILGGSVDIVLDKAEVSVVITFDVAVPVIVECGEGGTFSVKVEGKSRKDVVNKAAFYVISGDKVVVSINANANQTLDTITDNGDVVKRAYNYTIAKVTELHTIVITFRETGNTDVETFKVNIRIEGNGAVSPNGIVQVEKGEDLELELTPDSGYVVKSVTDRGTTRPVSGDTYTVKDIYKDCTVIVTFAKEGGEESEDSSAADSSELPDAPVNTEVITRAEVEASKAGNIVFISLAKKTKIGKDALSYINELAKDSAITISIGVSGSYSWVLPKGAAFDAVSGDIDFGVNVDKGAVSANIKKVLAGKLDGAVYDLQNNITIERLSAAKLPDGTRLELSLGTYGEAYGWFKYEQSGSILPAYGTEGALAVVANDGSVTVDMPAPQLYGVLVPYKGEYVSATLKWNGNTCSIFAPGAITTYENGECSAVVAWRKGVDFCVSVSVKSGCSIESISSADYGDMSLFAYGLDVTETHAKEEKGTIEIKIPAISKDGTITVQTTESGEQSVTTPGGKTPWDVIILIAVIVIAMVAGGVVFVVKWRQSDEEDYDDEDDEDDDDDDDYEDDDE